MITGIIAEFNPFHKGHEYIINEAKKRTHTDDIVIAMSGDFVQRGSMAIMDKYTRTLMALNSGASMVLEIPAAFTMLSAESYARAGVSLLRMMNVATLCFGAESDRTDLFYGIASVLMREPLEYKTALKEAMSAGDNYGAAVCKAFLKYYNATPSFINELDAPITEEELQDFITSPNNILGIEYTKAILTMGLPMDICPIKRVEANHNDLTLQASISSATAIRNALKQHISLDAITNAIPEALIPIYQDYEAKNPYIYDGDLDSFIAYELMGTNLDAFMNLPDVSDDLAKRLYNNRLAYKDYDSFAKGIATKGFPYVRIRRAVNNLILRNNKDIISVLNYLYPPYIHVLGIRKNKESLLSYLNNSLRGKDVMLIFNLKEDTLQELDNTDKKAAALLRVNIRARELYLLVANSHLSGNELRDDYKTRFICI